MSSVRGRVRWIGLLSACFVMGTGMTSLGAEISSVSVTVKDSLLEGEIQEPTVQISSYGCELGDVSWSKEISDWKPGKKVQMELTINSSSDKTFSSSYSKNNCRISGADYISAKAAENTTLIVKADYTPVVKLGTTERAVWGDTNKTKASWKKVEYATAYQVRLYRDESLIKTLTVDTNSVDLTEYMKSGLSYSYEVRAIGKTSAESKYLKDGDYVASEDTVEPNLGDTSGTWRDYSQGSKYKDESGNYVTNSWKMIYGKWYYFNQEGYAVKGWQNLNGKWYYLDPDGAMRTGWVQVNNLWYYLNSSGEMVTGWLQAQPGTWYYLDTNGAMLSNTMVGTYRLDENGVWVQ